MAKIYVDRGKCVHCGACTAVCPSAALRLEGNESILIFEETSCEDCGSCVKACPLRAINKSAAVRWLYA